MTQEKKIKYIKDEPVSRVRQKAKNLEKSRDDWKEKNRESKDDYKNLKKRMSETKVSRDSWQLKYLKAAEEARACNEKIIELEEELLNERLEKFALAERFKKKS